MSPEYALAHLLAESGKSFDPRVVASIERHYHELEVEVRQSPTQGLAIETISNAQRQAAPSAGFEEIPDEAEVRAASFLASIVSARQEAQLLFELAQTLGNSLSLRETLSVVAVRLKEMIPYDSIAFYICEDGKLVPRYVHGVDYDLFTSIEIPLGQGVTGWVAQTEKPIINGDPAAETKYLGDRAQIPVLQSALSVPLRVRDGAAGVLSLYSRA